MSKGKLIVLEGLDGSGKGTQAKLLAKHLTVTDHLVREITFPDYDSDSSALVKMYLAGQFGDKPDDVNAYAASSFYAVDRYAGYKSDWGKFYEEGGILIADRYTTSNAVHQCSKLPPEQWDKFLQWLHDEWGSDELTWETRGEGSCLCRDVMSFERYVKVAQLELYCVPDEVVETFLTATEGEKDDGAVVAAYESIVVTHCDAPVDFGEGDLSYLRGATPRILARGRLVMARFRLAQATMTVARKPTA